MTHNDQLLVKLMKEAQNGDASSYETLLSEVQMFLKSYLNLKVYNKSQIDDVIQEILLSLHKSRHTFNPEKSFMSWLLAITHYKVSDQLRLQFKQKNQELDESLIDPDSDALNKLIEYQDLQTLHRAIDELEPRPKKVIELLKIEGLKITEVADKLNLSESNIKVIAHRAYQALEIKLRSKL